MPLDINNHEHIQKLLSSYLAEKNPNLSDFDKGDFNGLVTDALQGLDSAQYLTGHKKKEVETFYDAHPIQATIHDTLNKAPVLGAAAVGAQAGHSLIKDHLLNRKINNAVKGSDKKPGMSPLTAEDYTKSPDLKRAFPKATQEVVGKDGPKIQFNSKRDPGVYADTYQKLNVGKSELQKPNASGPIANLLQAPDRKNERLVRLMSQRFPKDTLGAGEKANPGHFGRMAKELGGINSSRAANVGKETAKRIADPNMHFKNLLSHVNPRLAAGAGAAGLGGMALAPVVSYLQKKVYGNSKVKEWNTNRRMTEGKFD